MTSLMKPGSTRRRRSTRARRRTRRRCGRARRGCGRRIVERVHGGRDDVQPGAQTALDVVERLGWAEVARGAVGHRIGAGGEGGGTSSVARTPVGGPLHSSPASRPTLAGFETMTPASSRAGSTARCAGPARRRCGAPDDHAMRHGAHLIDAGPVRSRRNAMREPLATARRDDHPLRHATAGVLKTVHAASRRSIRPG
jgi:hypothetical protein